MHNAYCLLKRWIISSKSNTEITERKTDWKKGDKLKSQRQK